MPSVYYGIVRPYEVDRDRFGRPLGASRPMLRVRLVGRQIGAEFFALVDSGADRSLFPLDAASDADIDLAQCRTGFMRGVGGRIQVYVCRTAIVIEGRRFEIDAAFVDDPGRRTLALLGRNGVFTEFQFGFDQRAGQLLIEPYP